MEGSSLGLSGAPQAGLGEGSVPAVLPGQWLRGLGTGVPASCPVSPLFPRLRAFAAQPRAACSGGSMEPRSERAAASLLLRACFFVDVLE